MGSYCIQFSTVHVHAYTSVRSTTCIPLCTKNVHNCRELLYRNVVQETFLHSTVENYHLGPLCRKLSYTQLLRTVIKDHCAGNFPTLDSLRTIVQETFLHSTVENCNQGPLCRNFPTLDAMCRNNSNMCQNYSSYTCRKYVSHI